MVQENEEEAFYKMQDAGEKEAWFKMQIWMLQFLVRDFKESDGAIIGGVSITTPKSSRRVWFASKTTAGMQTAAMSNLLFALFDTICFKLFISKPYLVETCSHVITSSASSSPLLYLASVVKDCER